MQAGRLIAQALEFESQGDYEEAFDLMKAGVDVLLNGVQSKFRLESGTYVHTLDECPGNTCWMCVRSNGLNMVAI